MKVYAIELLCETPEQTSELCAQLEQQCIQTVETTQTPLFSCSTQTVFRVQAMFGDELHPELVELLV